MRTTAGWPNHGLENVISQTVMKNLKLKGRGPDSADPNAGTDGTI